jgi:RPA family protein
LTWAIDPAAQKSWKVETARVAVRRVRTVRQRWARSSRVVVDAISLSRSIKLNKLW